MRRLGSASANVQELEPESVSSMRF